MSAPRESEMARFWREDGGPRWVQLQDELDRQLAGVGEATLDAAALQAGESVLDIGCGCGASTIGLADRLGPESRLVGLDVAGVSLARARERLDAAGHAHVELVERDARDHGFASEFDLLFSRFGLMFFEEPAEGLAAVRQVLRPGGRLTTCCWRDRAANAWFDLSARAAEDLVELPPPAEPGAPGPFAFEDGERLQRLLDEAGWTEVVLERWDGELAMGGGGERLEATVDFTLKMGPLARALADADDGVEQVLRDRLTEAFEPHFRPGVGAVFPATSWIVHARNP
ncbi:MAG: class I SAM-dependent methyltransferase [Acidobacteriota bacterium]